MSKIEYLIISTLLQDTNLRISPLIISNFESHLFLNSQIGILFGRIKDYYETYHKIPTLTVLENDLSERITEHNQYQELIKIIEIVTRLPIDFDRDFEYIHANIDNHLKYVALRYALLESTDYMEDRDKYGDIEANLKLALTKTLSVDIGIDYWKTLEERIRKQVDEQANVFPTYLDEFDEMLNGGFRAGTLSVFLGITHVGKSNYMLNIAKRVLLKGKKVVYITLEMPELMVTQRFDAYISGFDINHIYRDEQFEATMDALREMEKDADGKLLIKEFPTYSLDFIGLKAFLNELKLYGFDKDYYLFIDSMNLMKYKGNSNDSDHSGLKSLSAQLKGYSLEAELPVITCTHLNRGAYFKPFEEVQIGDIGLCLAIGEIADTLFLLGKDMGSAIYTSEFLLKALKNRIGGRVGDILKMYMNPGSLNIFTDVEFMEFMDSLDVVNLTKEDIINKGEDEEGY